MMKLKIVKQTLKNLSLEDRVVKPEDVNNIAGGLGATDIDLTQYQTRLLCPEPGPGAGTSSWIDACESALIQCDDLPSIPERTNFIWC